MDGSIGVLNVGAGDTKLVFDPKKPQERKRAAAAVAQMLRAGFAILVQVGEKDGKPLYQRAEAFDEKTCEYLIVGAPGPDAADVAKRTGLDQGPPLKIKRGKKAKTYRVPAAKTHAVSVARSAGG